MKLPPKSPLQILFFSILLIALFLTKLASLDFINLKLLSFTSFSFDELNIIILILSFSFFVGMGFGIFKKDIFLKLSTKSFPTSFPKFKKGTYFRLFTFFYTVFFIIFLSESNISANSIFFISLSSFNAICIGLSVPKDLSIQIISIIVYFSFCSTYISP